MASLTEKSSESTLSGFSNPPDTTTTSIRPRTGRRLPGRPRTAISTVTGVESQNIICAISESRGISPTVGLAFVNLDTLEAILCQIDDNQTYIRTIHKINVILPSEILIINTASNPESKLLSVLKQTGEELNITITLIDRYYFAETSGLDLIQQLALHEDIEAIKISITGKYFAICCIAAVLKYIENVFQQRFPFHSLRIKYESSEGSMMIDLGTIFSLELIQNMQDSKSKDCLYGLLNENQTAMGSRLLRSHILQPLTDVETLIARFDALEELSTKEDMFFSVRQALNINIDVDKLLTSIIIISTQPLQTPTVMEQNVNKIIMLNEFILSIRLIYDALAGSTSHLLSKIREFCSPSNIDRVINLIQAVINEDVQYSKVPLDLRYQRVFSVKSQVNPLLDVARNTFKDSSDDAIAYVRALGEEYDLKIDLKFDPIRHFYIRLSKTQFVDREIPNVFVNLVHRKEMIECSTLELVKRNQRIFDSYNECLKLSDNVVESLIEEIRKQSSSLFKISESIAMLDMITGFAHIVTTQDYIRPQLIDTLAIQTARHPVKAKIQKAKFVPNDVYATQQYRFQIVTGCNMSGKSTYLRTIALHYVMAQIGCFLPASYATLPIRRQLFARVSADDSSEATVSTFAAEMQEAAFILRNIDRYSLAIIDELGRGTSTQDGLGISIAIAEALVDSRAFVWFATHFTELAKILAERNSVVNLHLSVEMPNPTSMTMLYKVAAGAAQQDHYGISLAKLIPLLQDLLEHAETCSVVLKSKSEQKKKMSSSVMLQRRRGLILSLKEHLLQARNSRGMEGHLLTEWLLRLRKEFVTSFEGA